MITLHKEPNPEPPFEPCCFCRKSTPYWFFPYGLDIKRNGIFNEVACCPECAAYADHEDMPSKKEWMRRERIVALGNETIRPGSRLDAFIKR